MQRDILEHVYSFYQELMGAVGEERAFLLGPNLWPVAKCISMGENLELERTFTGEELDEVLLGMKADSAPGPDGLPVAFFQKFWES